MGCGWDGQAFSCRVAWVGLQQYYSEKCLAILRMAVDGFNMKMIIPQHVYIYQFHKRMQEFDGLGQEERPSQS